MSSRVDNGCDATNNSRSLYFCCKYEQGTHKRNKNCKFPPRLLFSFFVLKVSLLQRDSEGVKVYRNLCTFNALLAVFLIIASVTIETTFAERNVLLLTSWCNLLIQAYILVCIHSLALKFDDQRFPSLLRHGSTEFHSEFDDCYES